MKRQSPKPKRLSGMGKPYKGVLPGAHTHAAGPPPKLHVPLGTPHHRGIVSKDATGRAHEILIDNTGTHANPDRREKHANQEASGKLGGRQWVRFRKALAREARS